MIRVIRVTNFRGETLELELANPYKSGFAVTEVSGLGPPEATINMTDVATNDGAFFNSAKLQTRNIVISLMFVGTDIEALRQTTYKYFPLKKYLDFEVETDKRKLSIRGYVESNTPDIFSKQETTQISIICPQPFFKKVPITAEYSFYAEESEFSWGDDIHPEAPEADAPLNEGEAPQIVMGTIRKISRANLTYSGDSTTGVTFVITALGPADTIKIYNVGTNEAMYLNISLVTGDTLTICTTHGEKRVTLEREGKKTNALNCLDKNANWFQLAKGDNWFAYTANGMNNLMFQAMHDVLYEGV